MEYPINASELGQVLTLLQMDDHDYNRFSRKDATTGHCNKENIRQHWKRKKGVENVPLNKLSSGIEHREAKSSIHDSLKSKIKMAFPITDQPVCVCTNADKTQLAAFTT